MHQEIYVSNLKQAKQYITKMYFRICKAMPIIRIQDGKLKYIAMELWCLDYHPNSDEYLDRLEMLIRIVLRATDKYPELEDEICEDLVRFEHLITERDSRRGNQSYKKSQDELIAEFISPNYVPINIEELDSRINEILSRYDNDDEYEVTFEIDLDIEEEKDGDED